MSGRLRQGLLYIKEFLYTQSIFTKLLYVVLQSYMETVSPKQTHYGRYTSTYFHQV